MNILHAIHTVSKAMTRIDAEEVTLVAVVWVFIIPIIEPLLQIPFLTYFIRLQARESLVGFGNKVIIQAQHKGRITGISKAFANHRQIGRATIKAASVIILWRDIVILGRGTGGSDKVFGTINTHILQVRPWLPKEIGCLDYMAEGMADLSVFLPLYQGVTSYPHPYTVGTKHSDPVSAYWRFRKVSALGMVDYNEYAPLIKKTYAALEAENDLRQKEMEEEYLAICGSRPIAAREMLQDFSDKVLKRALAVTDGLIEELFTRLTRDVQTEYLFHGA